jgi:uncharacterized protein
LKLTLAQTPGLNHIGSYGPGYLTVSGVRYETSLVIAPDALDPRWPVATLDALDVDCVMRLLGHKPEVVLIGTGDTLRFPSAQVLRPLIEAKVGYELMDTRAACRTYNVLVAESRKVVAGLIVIPA